MLHYKWTLGSFDKPVFPHSWTMLHNVYGFMGFTVGPRNHFTIFFRTLLHIIKSGINNRLFNASCDLYILAQGLKVGVACYILYDVSETHRKVRNSYCRKVRKITLLLPVMNNTANKGSS